MAMPRVGDLGAYVRGMVVHPPASPAPPPLPTGLQPPGCSLAGRGWLWAWRQHGALRLTRPCRGYPRAAKGAERPGVPAHCLSECPWLTRRFPRFARAMRTGCASRSVVVLLPAVYVQSVRQCRPCWTAAVSVAGEPPGRAMAANPGPNLGALMTTCKWFGRRLSGLRVDPAVDAAGLLQRSGQGFGQLSDVLH